MKVRKIRYRSGKTAWQLDLGLVLQLDGSRKRVQTYYATREEAEGELAKAKAKRRQHGDSSLSFSEDERIRFSAARDQLAAAGATIEQAVAHYLRHHKALQEPVSLDLLLKKCLKAKKDLGKSARYLQQLKCSCLNFIRGRETQLAHTVTRDEVRQWVLGQGWAPKTQRVYLGDLRALFAWAVSERLMPENPASGEGDTPISLAALDESPIERLALASIKRLFRRIARTPKPGEEDFRPLLWYAVIGIYAGVRPQELERIDRSAVCLEERHVTVGAAHAKTRKRRVVDLSLEACAWLSLDKVSKGPIIPVNFVRRWRRLRAAVGLLPWPHDVMRHTFASMHYADRQNEAALKAQMGHSAAEDTLMQHYRALVPRREARAFWLFAPSSRREKVWATRSFNEPEPEQRRAMKALSLPKRK